MAAALPPDGAKLGTGSAVAGAGAVALVVPAAPGRIAVAGTGAPALGDEAARPGAGAGAVAGLPAGPGTGAVTAGAGAGTPETSTLLMQEQHTLHVMYTTDQ